jgi:hypothetical protein
LELYYSGHTVDVARKKFREEFAPHESELDSLRTIATGESLLVYYFSHYANEPFDVIEVERPFRVRLVKDVDYVGRLDLIVRWHTSGHVRGVEHKTTTRLGGFITDPNNQGMGYAWALSQLYPDETIEGIVFNLLGVYKPMLKKGLSKYEKGEAFRRAYGYYSPHRLNQWRARIIGLLEDITRWHERGIFSDNTVMCHFYNSDCPYLALCQAETDQAREDLMESLYEVDPWSPGEEIIGVV